MLLRALLLHATQGGGLGAVDAILHAWVDLAHFLVEGFVIPAGGCLPIVTGGAVRLALQLLHVVILERFRLGGLEVAGLLGFDFHG